jgi:hypothetical protein
VQLYGELVVSSFGGKLWRAGFVDYFSLVQESSCCSLSVQMLGYARTTLPICAARPTGGATGRRHSRPRCGLRTNCRAVHDLDTKCRTEQTACEVPYEHCEAQYDTPYRGSSVRTSYEPSSATLFCPFYARGAPQIPLRPLA